MTIGAYKRGTIANLTIVYDEPPYLKQTWRAIMDDKGYWHLENSKIIDHDSALVAKVQPLKVIDAQSYDFAAMLKDLMLIRDSLKNFSGVLAGLFPRAKSSTEPDIWSKVCDLVDVFSDFTNDVEKEATPEPPKEPGIGGIVHINGESYSRGVDRVWRNSGGMSFVWGDITRNVTQYTEVSPGIEI